MHPVYPPKSAPGQFICVLLTAAVGLLHSCCATTIVYYYHLLGYSAAWGLTNMDTSGTVTFCPDQCGVGISGVEIYTGNAVRVCTKRPL